MAARPATRKALCFLKKAAGSAEDRAEGFFPDCRRLWGNGSGQRHCASALPPMSVRDRRGCEVAGAVQRRRASASKGAAIPSRTLAQRAACGYGEKAWFARRGRHFSAQESVHGLPFLLRRHHRGDLRPYLYQENVSQQTSLMKTGGGGLACSAFLF